MVRWGETKISIVTFDDVSLQKHAALGTNMKVLCLTVILHLHSKANCHLLESHFFRVFIPDLFLSFLYPFRTYPFPFPIPICFTLIPRSKVIIYPEDDAVSNPELYKNYRSEWKRAEKVVT